MQKNKFNRGFKSWCEKASAEYRAEFGLNPYEPLPPKKLLEKFHARLLDFDELPLPQESKEYLLEKGVEEWSAVTVIREPEVAIVVNKAHTTGRQNNSLMHELSHIILKHKPTSVSLLAQEGSDNTSFHIAMRSFNEELEQEADWLAAALLLPRAALSHVKYSRIPKQQVLEDYGVSEQLYTYRLNVTGLNRRS